MTSSGQSLRELSDALPKLHIVKSTATVSAEKLPKLMSDLQRQHPEANAQTGDGLRLAWDDKWLLVRGSNTEPIVRLIAEADSEDEARALCDGAAALL
ncbi:MAG: phosphoglucosamine mutase, partial [Rubripirellula sp.]